MKSCAARDADLFFSTHAAIGPLRALSTWLHLRACPSCRARRAEMRHISRAVAGELRAGLPAWAAPSLARAVLIRVALAMLMISVGVAGAWVAADYFSIQRYTPSAASCPTCKPALPHCQ